MALVAWANLVLNTLSDLEGEVGDARLAFSKDGINYIESVQTAITNAKADILIDLKNDLTDVYVTRNGQYQQLFAYVRQYGYTYNDLDTMFDKIFNPEVLSNAANAKTMQTGWGRSVLALKPANQDMLSLAIDQQKYWKKEYEERFLKAKRALILDLNEDGQIIDQERVRTRGFLPRV